MSGWQTRSPRSSPGTCQKMLPRWCWTPAAARATTCAACDPPRRDLEGLYAVAGTFRMPVLPASVDVLLTHFSPVSAADFRRVVRPGGVVLVGGPGEDHLFSFKELLYDAPERFEPSSSLSEADGFELITVHRFQYKLELRGPGQVANLLAMTPFYWTADQDTQTRLQAVKELDTEIDVIVQAYRRSASQAG